MTSLFQTVFYTLIDIINSPLGSKIIVKIFGERVSVWLSNKSNAKNKKLKNEILKIVEPIIEERDCLKKENIKLKQKEAQKPIHINFPT